jgi:hypothetical protein
VGRRRNDSRRDERETLSLRDQQEIQGFGWACLLGSFRLPCFCNAANTISIGLAPRRRMCCMVFPFQWDHPRVPRSWFANGAYMACEIVVTSPLCSARTTFAAMPVRSMQHVLSLLLLLPSPPLRPLRDEGRAGSRSRRMSRSAECFFSPSDPLSMQRLPLWSSRLAIKAGE